MLTRHEIKQIIASMVREYDEEVRLGMIHGGLSCKVSNPLGVMVPPKTSVSIWTWKEADETKVLVSVSRELDFDDFEFATEFVTQVAQREDGVWISATSGTPLSEVYHCKAKFYTVDEFLDQYTLW